MHDGGKEEPHPLSLAGLIARFGLLPTNPFAWGVAGDWLEDQGGSPILAAALRSGTASGDGSGNGNGDGYGYGSGNGNGYGDGYGDGYGNGDGYGDGYGNG